MAAAIIHIPDRWGKILTWVILAVFVFDALVSLVAVMRWHARVAGTAVPGVFWNVFDLRFPDERMQKIYANLVWS